MKKLLMALLLLAVVFVLASCGTKAVKQDPTPVVADEGVKLAEEDTVNGMFDVSGIDVKSYRIRGEGPDGAYFDWIPVTSSRVALSDIRRGEWTIYAEGLDANGNVIVTGKINTFLSENTPVDNLVLSTGVGQGDVKCDIRWNTSQVRNASLEVFVKPLDGDYAFRPAKEIAYIENGHMIWRAEDLTSGSYVARFILKDGSTVVSGAAAALRIVKDKVSVGDVKMTIGDLSTVYGITIENLPENTIKGELSLKDGVAVFVTSLDKSRLTYVWFVDGNEVAQETERLDLYTLGLGKGYHRVDLVVMSASETSINSSSLIVYVNPELAKNAPSDQDATQWVDELEALDAVAVSAKQESVKTSDKSVVNAKSDEVEGDSDVVFVDIK